MNVEMMTKELKEKRETLEKEKSQIEKKLNSITRELLLLHTECDHKDENGLDSFVYSSTDLRKDFYICTICGYRKSK